MTGPQKKAHRKEWAANKIEEVNKKKVEAKIWQ